VKGRKTKRIAVVANTTWNIYNFRLNIVRKLLHEGHEVIVMAPLDRYISYLDIVENVTHVPIRQLRRKGVNPIQDLLLWIELSILYRRYKPDLILHYTVKPNIYGGLAARLNGIPSVAAITGVGHPMIHSGWLKTIVSFLYKQTLPFHRVVIFENQDDKAWFDGEHLTKPDQSVAIKGCGIDTNYFSPGSDGRRRETVKFSFIGRLIYDKGVQEFIEAARIIAKKHKHAQFFLVGDADEGNPSAVDNEVLMDWVKHPQFHYHVASDEVRPFYENSDCIVLPSYRGEGLPRVIMEAMAMERPVITTNTAGCKEAVIDGYNGYLVPVKDVPALVHAMEKMIRLEHEDRVVLGKNGRIKALAEFDERIIVQQLYELLNV
jgi:glycosyltransferase involved in cell wall biosynthesis